MFDGMKSQLSFYYLFRGVFVVTNDIQGRFTQKQLVLGGKVQI